MTSRPPLHAVETLLVDLDDTLVDTRNAWRDGFAAAVAPLASHIPEFGAELSLAALHERLRRYTSQEQVRAGDVEWSHEWTRLAFRRLLAELGGTGEQADATWSRYRATWPVHLRLFEDALPMLECLRGRRRLGLVSNGLAADQRPKIERFGLDRFFPAVVISEEVALRKPDPAIFAYALEQLGAAGRPAAYVGDNPAHDVAGAHAAGLASVWLRRADGWHDSAGALRPDAELGSLAGLPPLLGVAPAGPEPP